MSNILVVRSRCHLCTVPFKPEEGSPAYDRVQNRRITIIEAMALTGGKTPEFDLPSFRRGGYKGLLICKYHWIGNTVCRKKEGRKLSKWEFNALPVNQRCFECNEKIQK